MSAKIGKLNELQREIVLRVLAKQFVEDGFDYQKAKQRMLQRLNYNIPPPTYCSYIKTIVRATFRCIQDFLANKCKKPIKPIDNDQQRIICRPMTQYKKWMKKDVFEVFQKFIKATYKTNYYDPQIYITANEAKLVYSQLTELIKVLPQKQVQRKEKKKAKDHKRLYGCVCLNELVKGQEKVKQEEFKSKQRKFRKKRRLLQQQSRRMSPFN